jgi:lactoylglutathione lyase
MNAYYIGLEHIGVFTPDIKKSEAFYVDTLGFDLMKREAIPFGGGTLQMVFVRAGTCVIELVQLPDSSNVLTRGNGLVDHFAIKVNDIEAASKRLMDMGVSFETEKPNDVPIFENGIKSIFFKGAFGERIEFCQHL